MIPSDFSQANRTFVMPPGEKGGDLRAEIDPAGGQVVSLWVMSWRERLSALVFGRCWVGVKGPAPPPMWLSTERDVHRNG